MSDQTYSASIKTNCAESNGAESNCAESNGAESNGAATGTAYTRAHMADKDGYTLAPVRYGISGVDVTSPFILTVPDVAAVGASTGADTGAAVGDATGAATGAAVGAVAEAVAETTSGAITPTGGLNRPATLKDITRALSIDGQPAPAVQPYGKGRFLITPALTLSPNSLYFFRLSRDSDRTEADRPAACKPDITWAFQTAFKFRVESSYPSDRATAVPIESGVEFNFSSDGYEPIDSYFNISPSVSGSFEYHKKTAVFVPDALKPATLYTVKLHAGLKLAGTDEKLNEDFIFSFETAPMNADQEESRASVYFALRYVELPTIEPPIIRYFTYGSKSLFLQNVTISIYEFPDDNQAIKAVQKLKSIPLWSHYAAESNYTDTAELLKINTVNSDFDSSDCFSRRNILKLPETLHQGFYLLEASYKDSRDQMIIQINDLPVQVVADGEQTLVWVNDILTGKASVGAQVTDASTGKVYLTDENGVAVINTGASAEVGGIVPLDSDDDDAGRNNNDDNDDNDDVEAGCDDDVEAGCDDDIEAGCDDDIEAGCDDDDLCYPVKIFTVESADGKKCVWIKKYEYYNYCDEEDYDDDNDDDDDDDDNDDDDDDNYYNYHHYHDDYDDDYDDHDGGYRHTSNGGLRNAYWAVFQLDRTLFKRDDVVSFFGFARRRTPGKEIKYITAVLTYGYIYGSFGSRDILQKQTEPVRNGAYSGEMKLPNLDPGSYNLTIYSGDVNLGSMCFNVMDYVKPPYKIKVSADKKAAFADDEVTFSAEASFFEGTPVSGLDISYKTDGYELITDGNRQGKTDADGKIEVRQKVTPEADSSGRLSLAFTAEATLPEIGRTKKNVSVRVFLNDINVDIGAHRSGADAKIELAVNSITLDRLNNGTANGYYDYLDKPVKGLPMTVSVFRAYFVKTENGSYYDFIEKKSVPKYSFERKEEKIDGFTVTTGDDGKALKTFKVPDREYESYYAIVSCVDGAGHKFTEKTYIGKDYWDYFWMFNSNEYYLDGGLSSYSVGDEVNLTLMCGTEAVRNGNILFVSAQCGIRGFQAGAGRYKAKFRREDAPNVVITAFYFNGYKYCSEYRMRHNARYAYRDNELKLTVATDKESYKPGEICIVSVKAEDAQGSAKAASINIGAVDEALFALRGYNVNTLAALYRWLGGSLTIVSSTHATYTPGTDDKDNAAYWVDDDATMEKSVMMMSAPADSEAGSAVMDGGGGGRGSGGGDDDDAYLREMFKDTAWFETGNTYDRGEAEFSFMLPDNITSWRLTVSGIGEDLYAGNAVCRIVVTNPMFLNYTLNDEFLTGDKPEIGVSVYGTGLSGGEAVEVEAWGEGAPQAVHAVTGMQQAVHAAKGAQQAVHAAKGAPLVVYAAKGAPFERLNVPIGAIETEGEHSVIIKATVRDASSGALLFTDTVKHKYRAFETYRQIDAAEYYTATPGMPIHVGESGLTNIAFTDRSLGSFLNTLILMRYASGDRAEKTVTRHWANKLIKEHFPELDLYDAKDDYDIKKYQQPDGGLAILTYASSDVETTVKLMPFIEDGIINVSSLKEYLYGVFEDDCAANKMRALYGLAMLREPVLLDLDNCALLEDLSVTDAVYIALAYFALGETGLAADLYKTRVAPRLEDLTPFYRVNTGADNDDILAATSAATLLASKIGASEREGLYAYCIGNYTYDILVNLEELSYIKDKIEKAAGGAESGTVKAGGIITYSLYGEEFTREVKYGSSFVLRIPAMNFGEFKLLNVSGDVGAVSVYNAPLTEPGKSDTDVTVWRSYYGANEFAVSGGADGRAASGGTDGRSVSGGVDGRSVSGSVFKQGDLVRVELKIDYSKKAINGSYCVTDYLPSGLEFVNNSAKVNENAAAAAGYGSYGGFGGYGGFGYGFRRYAVTEGQKVTFYDYNGYFDRNIIYYYYARVICPGVYKAEGALVQNLDAKGYYTLGEDSIITVEAD